MPGLEIEKVERYLKSVLESDVSVLELRDLSDPAGKLVKALDMVAPFAWTTRLPTAGTEWRFFIR
jgi:hypothetical protein